ncbi:hypothetical protein HMPREF0208_01316 [Citrobacter koseri]|uniref:Uncharacterized protein n=1 Tax=Citrobacter koseri (strain ATCC BAA-895 / CDC 4225-83 / SGSC4696) TaxID=290338 RepID=A8ADK5_CITK8|nr:hypothetical protein CKO_00410 [Citrobacter koseri ATCC BAA-895]KXB45572.1 hypothetical protein HMPREF0208_01316 [Citrobacter koseri]
MSAGSDNNSIVLARGWSMIYSLILSHMLSLHSLPDGIAANGAETIK